MCKNAKNNWAYKVRAIASIQLRAMIALETFVTHVNGLQKRIHAT